MSLRSVHGTPSRPDLVPNHVILWQPITPGSDIACRFGIPSFDGSLPFALWGVDSLLLSSGVDVEVTEKSLLFGLLLTIPIPDSSDTATLFGLAQLDVEVRNLLLARLFAGFGEPSVEQAVLNAALHLAEENLHDWTIRVLESGCVLVPRSSQIRSDLVMRLWEQAAKREDCAEKVLFERTLELFHRIDLSKVHSDARQSLCYYAFCAVVLLGRGPEVEPFFLRHVVPNVRYTGLKDRLEQLLYHTDNVSVASLCIS